LKFLLAAVKYSYPGRKWPQELWAKVALYYKGYFMALIFNFLRCHRLSDRDIFKNRIITTIASLGRYILEARTAVMS